MDNPRKGIILAGGSGTRLHPLTIAVSKQLMPVYNKPMIYYPLSVLMLPGIREILVITSPDQQMNFQKLLQDGSQFGIKLSYVVQEKPEGIAQAFILGESFIHEDPVALVLGDNLFFGHDLVKLLKQARNRVETSNGGEVWNLIRSFPSLSNSGNGQNSISSIASKNNLLYVGTGSSEGGIFYTEDLIQWDEYNEGLDSYAVSVSNLITSSNYIYKTGGVINAYQRELIQPSFLIADINLDGEIDVLDVIMIINFILLIEEPTSIEFYLSDVNSDNQIDILDIIYIINLILELN